MKFIHVKGAKQHNLKNINVNIPKNKQTVSVIGEVFVANSHIFRDQQNINDYINLSGGVTTFADEGSIYIIKSDGSILSPSQISSPYRHPACTC